MTPGGDVHAEDLARRIGGQAAPVILDVRTRAEFQQGHVPGAVNVPFWRFAFGVPRIVPRGADVVVYCGHGPRAHAARVLLRAHGVSRVSCLAGHMAGWRHANLPEERE